MASKSILRSLQITFGQIPGIIEEHLKYLSYNEKFNDFVCVPCDKIIQVVNNLKNTTKNFENHLLSNAHRSITTSDEELRNNLNQTFCYEVPQIVENNFIVLGMNGENYECVICEKTITVCSNVSTTENNFSYHLLSIGHEEKLEAYRETLSELHEIYGGIPQFVLNHSQFLKKNGKHYFCTICEKHIQVHPSDVSETEKIFESHLHSLKHIRNAKQTQFFSLIPELKKVFSPLPNYMLRNMEYFSVNGPNFFCSLCNKNIKYNRHDIYETRQNFKLHNLSSAHEGCLRNRRDSDNSAFNRLKSLFETFPDKVLEELKYIGIDGDDFFCNICKKTIFEDGNIDQTKINLISHFDSNYHEATVNFVLGKQSEVVDDLEELYGFIPQLIEDNIEHIIFNGGNVFECVLCNQIMESKKNGSYEVNYSVTKKKFEKHFNSAKHRAELETLKEVDEYVINKLRNLFSPIPQFIWNNLDYIGFVDNDNFHCYLCDKSIPIVNGSKKEDLTWQNFKNHLLSVGHMAKLKHRAHLKMEATEELQLIFHAIPRFIMNSIEHLDKRGNFFFCTLCDVRLPYARSEKTFSDHLYGARHKANVMEIEEDNDEALERLDTSFWRLPEFLLKNIDFLDVIDEDLFCLLCQEILPITDDLEETKRYLRTHVDSMKHMYNLKSL